MSAKARITRTDIGWQVYIPPTKPEHFDGDAIVAPWGESYWPTHDEACAFLHNAIERES